MISTGVGRALNFNFEASSSQRLHPESKVVLEVRSQGPCFLPPLIDQRMVHALSCPLPPFLRCPSWSACHSSINTSCGLATGLFSSLPLGGAFFGGISAGTPSKRKNNKAGQSAAGPKKSKSIIFSAPVRRTNRIRTPAAVTPRRRGIVGRSKRGRTRIEIIDDQREIILHGEVVSTRPGITAGNAQKICRVRL